MADEELGEADFDDSVIDDDDGEMPWESHAREAIQRALEQATYDEIRGVIYAPTSEGHRGDEVTEEFDSIDELLRTLRELGDEQWYAYVPYDEGPVFESTVGGMVERLADEHGVIEFFERVKPPSEGDELGTARDLVFSRAGLILQVDLSEINDELIHSLARHPEKMQDLTPRKFEELVAALFRAKGYDVELTPATRDGGFDMRAFHRNAVGTFLTLIECKRYGPKRPVSVDVIRGLYGVTEDEGATTGLLVTTSSFTRDAKSFQDKNKYRIQLADHTALQAWLREHRTK